MKGYRCQQCGRTCFTRIDGHCLECPAPSRPEDKLLVVLALVWCAVCVALVVLGGCHVYEEPAPCGRAHPGGGVSVNVRELAEQDGGE